MPRVTIASYAAKHCRKVFFELLSQLLCYLIPRNTPEFLRCPTLLGNRVCSGLQVGIVIEMTDRLRLVRVSLRIEVLLLDRPHQR